MVLAYSSVPMCSTGSNGGTFSQTCGACGAHSSHTLLIVIVLLDLNKMLNQVYFTQEEKFKDLLSLYCGIFGFHRQRQLFPSEIFWQLLTIMAVYLLQYQPAPLVGT